MVDQLLAGSDDYGQLWSIVKWFCSCHMALDNEIQSPKRRKLELSSDIDSLTALADQLAEKAESSRDMSILVKSNAMRKACKEKIAEMTELDQQMADKLLELKNCCE